MKKTIIFALLALTTATSALSRQAYNGTLTKTMPDGSTVEYRLHGNEAFHYMTLTDGTLIELADDGYFHYAEIAEGAIVASKTRIGEPRPSKALKASAQNVKTTLESISASRNDGRTLKQKKETVMTPANGLAIMVQYTDVQFKYSHDVFNRMLNEEGFSDYASTGSACDFFKNSSYGKYAPTFDLYGPYTLSNNQAYYGGNDRYGEDLRPVDMVIEACKLAEADGVDLSKYDYDGDGRLDNVYVFYAGAGEANGGSKNTVWPHRWNVYTADEYGSDANTSYSLAETKVSGVYVDDYACGNEICSGNNLWIDNDFEGVGTFVHEFGHVVGLMDHYCTGNSYVVTPGVYDVMDHGDYCNYGRTPASYSAYERMFCGWLTPTQIYPSLEGTEYELPVIDTGKAFLLTTNRTRHNMDATDPNPATFYLLENKSGSGWDGYLDDQGGTAGYYDTPGDKGMLITKISYNEYNWRNNMVNYYSSSAGVTFVTTSDQRATYYYPMFPGKRNATSIEFANFVLSDVTRDETTGTVKFKLVDKLAPQGGVGAVGTNSAKAIATAGRIAFIGCTSAEVFNPQGALLYSGNDSEIDIAPGLYIVNLSTIDGNKTTKVVVR